MNIIYLANMRFPNEKAHGKQVREMCNAFSTCANVTLVVPGRATTGGPREFGLDAKVEFVSLGVPDTVRFGRIGFLFTALCFALASSFYVFRRRKGVAVITREYPSAIMPSLFGVPTAWESHRGEWNIAIRAALHCGARIIAISKGLKDFYVSKKVPGERILVAPDGVDLSRYAQLDGVTREEARRRVGLSPETKIAIYNGHLHTWKGAGTLAQAAQHLPHDVSIVFMGGTDEDIELFKKEYPADSRVRIIGRKPDSERPLYLRGADVAVLPNTAKDEISAKYTSPLKLFGYMAAGVPIVASDLPSIREIIDDESAFFVEPDSAEALAKGIGEVLENPERARQKAERARQLVADYAWEKRAARIVDFLNRVKVVGYPA